MAVEKLKYVSADLIHDIEYNYYGTRIATCSSDKKIKIYDYQPETDSWVLSASWKAHNSTVLSVSWAHPEYGQMLASCSLDRTVKIWVEQEDREKQGAQTWFCATTLSDSMATVHKIAFAPEYMGLILAAASSDGQIRLYSPNKPVDLTNWVIGSTISATEVSTRESDGPLCISWNESQFAEFRMVAVGLNKPKAIRIFYQDKGRWMFGFELAKLSCDILDIAWAPQMGRTFHLIACSTEDGFIRIYQVWLNAASPLDNLTSIHLGAKSGGNSDRSAKLENSLEEMTADQESGYSHSHSHGYGYGYGHSQSQGQGNENGYNPENPQSQKSDSYSATVSASSGFGSKDHGLGGNGSGDTNSIGANTNESQPANSSNLTSANSNPNLNPNSNTNTNSATENSNPGAGGGIGNRIDASQSTEHIISATPSKTNNNNNTNTNTNTNTNSATSISNEILPLNANFASTVRAELVAELNEHAGLPVRRVKWNATGTVLISCGDDGTARIWQKQLDAKFVCKGTISYGLE